MIRTYWVAAFVFFHFFLSGQTQSNPFDLKYRPANPSPSVMPIEKPVKRDTFRTITPPAEIKRDTAKNSITPVLRDTSSAKNPFEIEKEPAVDTVRRDDSKQVKTEPAPVQKEPIERRKPSRGIQIFFLLLSLLFLIFIVNVERSFVRDLWKVISNENYSSLHLRNQRNTMRQILLLMGYAVFVLQAGIFLYHVLDLFNYQGTLLDNIWTCIALVTLIYTVRHSVISYLKWLFNNQKEMNLFSFDISIFNIMVGLFLLPINVLINFGPENLFKPLIIMGLIVVATAYIMRQLRWMLTARQLITNSLFLFFIYLCAIEILPLWAISRFLW